MLPPDYRLKDKDIIASLFKSGIILKNPLFNIYHKKITAPAQALVMVSAKVSKKAVDRNLIKRRIHEVFRKNISKLDPKLKIIVLAKNKILGVSQNEIEEEFKKLIDIK